MALYLKYRPRNFADVAGQDHLVTILERATELNQIGHAYLFSGSRGTGKTSVARILAKTILLRGVKDPVLLEQFTKAIEEGSFVDLVEIDAASNRRIDDVRDLIEKIGFSPAIAKAKVYIIDEVHMLTKEAFNALLKTLEEPPEYAFFILATTELHKVPETIQSRCQRFLFRKVKEEDVVRRLQYIADQEHIKADRDALRAIARHAGGSFRDGIALLDQLHSLEKITVKDVEERIGSSSLTFLDDIVKALGAKDVKAITELVAEIEESNTPLDTIAGDLLAMLREQMHAAIEAKKDLNSYIRAADILLSALKDMRSSPVPGLILEAALLSLCNLDEEEKKSEIATIAPRKEEKSAAAPEPVSKKETDEPKAGLVTAEELTVQNVLKHWDAVLKAVTPPSVRMSLKDASVVGVVGQKIKLSFPSSFHKEKVAETKASRTVEEVLSNIFKGTVRIDCVLESDVSPATVSASTDLVEAASEVFGGF